MTKSDRLLKRPATLPGTDLPPDWNESAVRRLQIVAAVAVAAALLSLFFMMWIQPNVGGLRTGRTRPLWTIPIGLLLSVIVFGLARSEKIATQRRLDIGIAYLVVCSFLAALFRHGLPYESIDVVRGVSVIGVAVLFFAVIIPVEPRRMTLAVVLALAMDPLGLAVSLLHGNPIPRPNFFIWLFAPGFVCGGLALIASRILYSMGRTVERARVTGSYELTDRLGAGAMGEVWRAKHHTLARPAAIKLVDPRLLALENAESVAEVLKRFEREAQATSRLRSPHTIEIYDYGETDDGSFYYVMELLDGMDLAAVVGMEGPLSEPRVVHILRQACHSLSEAHEAGMVHRDVKPSNIMLCRSGLDFDFVKVLDFGIVKYAERNNDVDLTKADALTGTPNYMAPEMITGEPVDGRTDLYCLACVAFFLLTGVAVFRKDRLTHVLVAHVNEPPPAIGDLTANPVSSALESLLQQCLAKDKDARPSGCEEFARRLSEISVTNPWTQEDARRLWSRPSGEDAVAPAQSTNNDTVVDNHTMDKTVKLTDHG